MADVLPWGVKEKLTLEKTAIGFYLTGHLFDEVEAEVRRFVRTPIGEMRDSREPQTMAGIISGLRTINGQRGKLGIFTLDDKSAAIEASVDEKVLTACADVLKEDEFVVVSGRLQQDRFSGGLRMKVQQMWTLADARCRFARYLQVSVGEKMPDVPALLRQFPAKVEETENGNIQHGVKVRLDLICRDNRGSASCELALGEASRFYPSDAALAAWYGSAGSGQVKVVYE